MARIYVVTSFKGGVGKSTVAANIAYKLALAGYKTLLCDLDFDLRTLDLITGCEDRMIFDVCDVIVRGKSVGSCAVTFGTAPRLTFLGAPYEYKKALDEESFGEGIKKLSSDFDFVILDTPGGDTSTLRAACIAADTAIVVATQQPTSLRGAEKTADELYKRKVKSSLIINCFDADSAADSSRAGILSMIDTTRIPLLGVVPYDRTLQLSQERGAFAHGSSFVSSQAFENIASRIISEQTGMRKVPILYKIKKIKRKKVLTK